MRCINQKFEFFAVLSVTLTGNLLLVLRNVACLGLLVLTRAQIKLLFFSSFVISTRRGH